jgi:tetrahydromethanopterin S-methyltransferase subunit H
MTYQPELDFVHTRENNAVSQKILDTNRVKLSSQVIKILKMLTYGYQNEHGVKVYNIDFATAYTQHGIGDLRRRICDIEQKFNIPVDRAYQNSGKATYSLNEFSQIQAKQLLNTLK